MVKPGEHKRPFLGMATFEGIGRSPSIRCSSRYNYFWQSLEGNIFKGASKAPFIQLSELIIDFESKKAEKGELEDEAILVELEDVIGGLGLRRTGKVVDYVNSDKVYLNGADFIYCKLDPERGKFFLPDSENDYVGSTEFIPIKLSNKVYPPFLHRLLLLPEVSATLGLIKAGKCQARADLGELKRLSLPIPDISLQVDFINNTKEQWLRLSEILDKIRDFTEIVDEGLKEFLGTTKINPSPIGMSNASIIGRSKLIRYGHRYLSMSIEFDKILEGAGNSVTLGSVVNVRGGKRLPKGTLYETKPTPYKYLRGSDVKDGKLLINQIVYISEEAFNAIERYQLQEDDVVLTIAGTIGKVAIARGIQKMGVTENVALMRPNNSHELLPEFLMYLFISSFMQFQMRKEMSELRQQKLSLEKIRLLRIPKPPRLDVQKKIVEDINKIFEYNHALIEEVKNIKRSLDYQLREFLGVEQPKEDHLELDALSTAEDLEEADDEEDTDD